MDLAADGPHAYLAPHLAADPHFEPITLENPARELVLDERYLRPALWDDYKKMEAMTWNAQEADCSQDRKHWLERMTPADRAYYRCVFALLGPADELIIQNIEENLLGKIGWMELQYFYRQQAQNEGVHSEAYSIQINNLFKGAELEALCRAATDMPGVRELCAWVRRWIAAPDVSYGTRMATFAFVEGVMFQGLFLSIQQLKERNLMPGVRQLNDLISRDEGLHCMKACDTLKRYIRNPPSQERVHRIPTELVAVLDQFFEHAVGEAVAAAGLPPGAPCPVEGITLPKLRDYVRSVADAVCVELGYEKLFRVPNPYPEASKLALNRTAKVNFFEATPSQYNFGTDFTLDAARALDCAVAGAAA